MAAINPTPKDVEAQVPELRAQFPVKFADSIGKGLYDPRDIDRLNSDDAYARCFLRTLKSKGDVNKALEIVNDAFLFRKDNGIWDLTVESFPQEMVEKNAIYYKGHDKDGHPLLYIDVSENTDSGDGVLMLKKYIAFHFEMHHRANPEQMCVVLFDYYKAGTSNMGLDTTKYVIACFTTYFPSFLAYMLNYEMPFVLTATWKIISGFLSSDQTKKIQMVKKKDITKYLNEDQLWEHMKPKK